MECSAMKGSWGGFTMAFVRQTVTNMSESNGVEWFDIVMLMQQGDRIIMKFMANR
jgi:hypothetical protein